MFTNTNIVAVVAILAVLAVPGVASAQTSNRSHAKLPANAYASTVAPNQMRPQPAALGRGTCGSIVHPYAADFYLASCGGRSAHNPDFQLTR
jgi:hypothetical protein